jgi:hypothetical protein
MDEIPQYSHSEHVIVPVRRRWPRILLGIAALAIILVAGAALGWKASLHWKEISPSAILQSSTTVAASQNGAASGYQAVFLTNGQVYFGKVENEKSDPVVIRDIYYLQVTQQLQPAPSPSPEASPQAVPQISLVKLGNELHGPMDRMHITRSQIVFIEDLKEDSQVVKAIKEATKGK